MIIYHAAAARGLERPVYTVNAASPVVPARPRQWGTIEIIVPNATCGDRDTSMSSPVASGLSKCRLPAGECTV
jgi:hypothetical protein